MQFSMKKSTVMFPVNASEGGCFWGL